MSTSTSASPDLVSTGIEGLDRILNGGLARDRAYLLEGLPGSGKTTASIQFLLAGTALGEAGMLVTHSESDREIRAIASAHGWNLAGIHVHEWRSEADARTDVYTIFHASEVELGDAMTRLFADFDRVRPRRLVFDSIGALRMLAQDEFFYRRQIQLLRRFFLERDCTVILIDDGAVGDPRAQTIVHGVITLENVAQVFGPARRQLRVGKMRGTAYSDGYHDFAIAKGGLQVYPRLQAREHGSDFAGGAVESGIPELDDLLGGGVSRGTSTLLLGPAGAGKSTLAGMYALSAARRGERALVLLFDEIERTWIDRFRGIGHDPTPFLANGLLRLLRLDPASVSPGWLSHEVTAATRAGMRLFVLDSVNGYLEAMAEERYVSMHLRELLTFLNNDGIATLMTVSQVGLLGPQMHSPIDVSFLADTVLLLRYFESAGRVHQAISVVKKRTGRHERTIREYRIDGAGVHVGEVLEHFTGLLTGVPRFLGDATRLHTGDAAGG